MLPQEDQDYLDANFPGHSVQLDSGMTCVVVPQFHLPVGYSVQQADLLLTLSSLYPDAAPDMWWFDPPIARTDGQAIPNTDQSGTYVGRTWQRWSRHLSADQWQSGIDCLKTYIALIRTEAQNAAS